MFHPSCATITFHQQIDPPRPARSRLRRRWWAAAVAVTALGAAVFTPAPAQADVKVMRAALACEYARVLAYPPAPAWTMSTLAYDRLDTKADLYRYDPTAGSYAFVQTSGWWAYTRTNRVGHPSPVLPGAFWATPGNRGARFFPFAAIPGYSYRVQTFVYDHGDHTTRYVWNLLNVSDPSLGDRCQTG